MKSNKKKILMIFYVALSVVCTIFLVTGHASAACESGQCAVTSSQEMMKDGVSHTYRDLVTFLASDDTNKQSFSSSRKCSEYLISHLTQAGWEAKLKKAYFGKNPSTGRYKVRYCVEVKVDDQGIANIDSFSSTGNGIDKRVTQLKAGKQWLASSADGTCPYDATGLYNRGNVTNVTYPA
jgi:hypothetical protein